MSLKYSKDAVIKGFVGVPVPDKFPIFGEEALKFTDTISKPRQQTINELFQMANNCRWWYQPSFADDTKYLQTKPVESAVTNVVSEKPRVASIVDTTPPRKKVEDNTIKNVLILGAGIFILYKLLS